MSSGHPVLKDKLLLPFIAPPNGGKGTQTKILSDRYNLPTFDMGGTFRAILKKNSNPALADELKTYMNQGKLVPVETVLKVFTSGFEALADNNPDAPGFILDGFPRNPEQAEGLLKLCEQWEAKLAKVIYLDVPLDIVTQRATGRRFCAQDATHVYNINVPALASKQPNVCDKDGAELILRPDDEAETVQKRLVEYQNETNPLIALFTEKGLLARIDGDQAPEKVTEAVEAIVTPLLNLTSLKS